MVDDATAHELRERGARFVTGEVGDVFVAARVFADADSNNSAFSLGLKSFLGIKDITFRVV